MLIARARNLLALRTYPCKVAGTTFCASMRKHMFVVISVALLSLGAFRSDMATDMLRDHEWSQWKVTHTKYYTSNNEELERYVTWRTNKAYVEYHNAFAEDFGYSLALNKFGDMVGN